MGSGEKTDAGVAVGADIEPRGSYFDTTIGGVFLHVPPPTSEPEFLTALRQAKAQRYDSALGREQYVRLVTAWIDFAHFPLVAHEHGHVLQAITHPGLYLRCLRELSAVVTVIGVLREEPGNIGLPFVPSEPWGTELAWSNERFRISIDQDGMPDVEIPSPGWPRAGDLSETDLLEGSASIFQYKAEIGADGSSDGYRHWLGEEGASRDREAFEYLSKILSPEDAYVALPPLVMAAYETNYPVNGFASLLAMTVREAPRPSEMGIDLYWAYLHSSLRESAPAGEPPDPRMAMEKDGPHRRLDSDGVLAMASQMPMHPLTPLVERAWRDEEELRRLREAMLHPALAFDRHTREARDWLDPYRPPATGYLMVGEIEISEMPLALSPTILGTEPPVGYPSWQEYVIDLIRFKGFVFSAATPLMRRLPHNCPHTKCPLHRHDMCRGWIHVPARHTECNFPKWLRTRANRRYDPMMEALELV